MQKHKKLLSLVLIMLSLGVVGCSKASTTSTVEDIIRVETDSSVKGTEISNLEIDVTDCNDSKDNSHDENDFDNESTDESLVINKSLIPDKDSKNNTTVQNNATIQNNAKLEADTIIKKSDSLSSESINTGDNDNESSVTEVNSSENNSEISEEDIKFADKVKAFKLAAKRLSGDQISELMDMAKGGFTPEEKARAKELFYKNFTDEEREWILNMYEKYY